MSDLQIVREIHRLRGLTVNQLRDEWFRLFGQPTTSRHKDFLFRRLAWKVQANQLGGLSERARRRIDELAPDYFDRTLAPGLPVDIAEVTSKPRVPHRRDSRDPIAGSVITKRYKGRDLRVVVRDTGYEYDGAMFESLTALAREITGSKNINGKLFFGLTRRKRG